MKSEEEFEAFLQESLLPELERRKSEFRELEARRDALRLPRAWKYAIWIVGGLTGVFLFKSVGLLCVSIVAPFLIDFWRLRGLPLPPVSEVKRRFLERAIEFHDPSFDYSPAAYIQRSSFEQGRLFEGGGRVDRYHGEDLVQGKVGATTFRFSELRVARRRGRGKQTKWEPVFSGLYLIADFNKHFEHPIFVLPDKTEKHLGLAARALQSLPGRGIGRLLHLEDPTFERCFKVYGHDEVEARYVLSPSLMRRLVQFRESNNDDVRLAFVGGAVHVAMPLPGDLFEVRQVSDLDATIMRSWAVDLAFATGLIEELDLNTRIWSKAAD